MKSTIFLASLLAVSQAMTPAPKPIAKATINIAGATGWVKVSDGKVSVMLDLTNFNFSATRVNRTQCRAGITYHIHAAIANPSVGDLCGAAGGHYDPWLACGGATGNKACLNKGGCVPRTYTCNPTAFMADPFACEVGDWSGKYGKLMPTNSTSDIYMWSASTGNQYEVSSEMLYNPLIPDASSVVFHCGSPRILCANFTMDTTMTAPVANMGPGLAATPTAERSVADFGSLGGPLVWFGGGQVQVSEGVPGVTGMKGIEANCTTNPINMAILVGSIAGNGAASGPLTSTCLPNAGVWDPTFSCVPASQNGVTGQCQPASLALSMTTYRCNATFGSFNYTRDAFLDKYLAAQGALLPWNPMWINVSQPFRLMNQMPTVIRSTVSAPKMFAITCGLKIWCTNIRTAVGHSAQRPPAMPTTTPAPAPTSSTGRVVIRSVFVVLGLSFLLA